MATAQGEALPKDAYVKVKAVVVGIRPEGQVRNGKVQTSPTKEVDKTKGFRVNIDINVREVAD